MVKMIEDGLVVCGIIPDDTFQYVRMTSSEVMNSLEKLTCDTITVVFKKYIEYPL